MLSLRLMQDLQNFLQKETTDRSKNVELRALSLKNIVPRTKFMVNLMKSYKFKTATRFCMKGILSLQKLVLEKSVNQRLVLKEAHLKKDAGIAEISSKKLSLERNNR